MAEKEVIVCSIPIGTVLKSNNYIYRIEKVLGQGSFGITYLAKAEFKGKKSAANHSFRVAVKEFFMKEINGRNELAVTSDVKEGLYDKYKEQFAKEAQNLKKLDHPNIVSIIDFFAGNNTYYYAMDYLCGGSLDSLIEKESAVTEEHALKYIFQIGNALSYMHSNRMLHLDVKPANVMLNVDDEAVVIDFGLSKQYDDKGEPESTTTVGRGTPGYAPVEQVAYQDGHGFPVTMDIYALGATLFKLLVGVRPPDASVILNDGFPSNQLKQRKVSQQTINVIAKAMSPMKKDRYQSVEDFLKDLNIVVYADSDEVTIIDDNEKDIKKLNSKREKKKIKSLAEVLQAADDAYSRKDYSTALTYYLEAFRRDNSLGKVARTIADIYYHGYDLYGSGPINKGNRSKVREKSRSKASDWYKKAYDLAIDKSEELVDQAKLFYWERDYVWYLESLQECVRKHKNCKEAYLLLIEAYEKGIGCNPRTVSWELERIKKEYLAIGGSLKDIKVKKNNYSKNKTTTSEQSANQTNGTSQVYDNEWLSCAIYSLFVLIALSVFIVGAAYDSRVAGSIFDSNEYEDIFTTGNRHALYRTTYYKVFNPKDKLWGVVKVHHESKKKPHPNTDEENIVLPIEYDSIDVDIIYDFSSPWKNGRTVSGYKDGELCNQEWIRDDSNY